MHSIYAINYYNEIFQYIFVEYRDRVRLDSLERQGYNAFSLDNKHDETRAPGM